MDSKRWNRLISQLPEPHLLQTWEWGQVKGKFGWLPIYKNWGPETNPDAAALVLERSVSPGNMGLSFRIHYVPKGPLLRDWCDQDLVEQVLVDLQHLAKSRGAIFVKADPDVIVGKGIPDTKEDLVDPSGEKVINYLETKGWIYSDDQIQFRNTVLIDLKPAEDEILAKMKQKTRYNVRLAGRRGVSVRIGTREDFDLLYRMYAETSIRDGFAVREANYYHSLWDTFLDRGEKESTDGIGPSCRLIIAEVEGEAIAGMAIFIFAGKAYYMHGMSRPVHREKMPNYLLQWEAMLRAKESGCLVYDLWGAPEEFNDHDSMWGVYRFKEGLGGKVVRTIGAYDLPVRPFFYRMYTKFLPKVLDVMRWHHSTQLNTILRNMGEDQEGLN